MRLRVLTYNVHKCLGGVDRRYDPYRVADVVGHYEPDLVLLQEVTQAMPRTGMHRQVDLLGDLLGLRHRTFFVNVRWRRRGEYGNAILSRFPLTETQNLCLKVPGKKARSALHAKFRVRISARRTRTLHAFCLHLGLSGIERKYQLRRFLAMHPFAGLDHRTPIVIGGDFNDVWGELGRFLEPHGFTGPTHPQFTFPAIAPVRALDSIYVRGELEVLRIARSRLAKARQASDHLPLLADLDLRRRRGGGPGG